MVLLPAVIFEALGARLGRYDVPAEAPGIAEFEATGRVIIYPGKQDWLDLIADRTAAGRTIRRIHTVHASTLSAYLG